MTVGGLEPLVDAGAFLERGEGGEGSACVTAVVLEGNRPLLIEIQVSKHQAYKSVNLTSFFVVVIIII